MTLGAIENYEVTRDRGFLSAFDPDQVAVPDSLQSARELALNLPQILPTGDVRRRLRELPLLDAERFCQDASDPQKRVAMVHYSFLVQSYVWGEPEAPARLPETLARPIWALAHALGQQPLLPYSGYVLDNWGRVDPDGPIDLSNTFMIQPFLGGQDEAWFVLIHVAIEARAGAMLAVLPGLAEGAAQRDADVVERALSTIAGTWGDLNAIFDRMPERCDPYVYFHRVRPWIHGWRDNPALGEGLIYEGVAETSGRPQAFRGQTGSQSSIVPAMDAALGVKHADDPLRSYLDELHAYRPPAHRRFIEDLRAHSGVRAYVEDAAPRPVIDLYNECIRGLTRFRTKHLEYAASYINRQQRGARGNDSDVGTGGTPFMKYLKKHRDEAEAHLVS